MIAKILGELMKQLNMYFEDSEFKQLKVAKGAMSWHDFVIEKCLGGKLVKG